MKNNTKIKTGLEQSVKTTENHLKLVHSQYQVSNSFESRVKQMPEDLKIGRRYSFDDNGGGYEGL